MKKNVPITRRRHVLPLPKCLLVINTLLLLTIFNVFQLRAELPGKTAVITGTVTGENNQPLIGAAVKEKGTNNGVMTNEKGEFSINVGDNAVLVISYIGYTDKQVPVNGQSNLAVQLTLSQSQLDQVV